MQDTRHCYAILNKVCFSRFSFPFIAPSLEFTMDQDFGFSGPRVYNGMWALASPWSLTEHGVCIWARLSSCVALMTLWLLPTPAHCWVYRWDSSPMSGYYIHTGDLKSGSHVWTANNLHMESSSSPGISFIILINLMMIYPLANILQMVLSY